MKIVAISDGHGNLPNNIPSGDVLVIAGDISPSWDHSVSFQKHWLESVFNPWLKSLPFDKDHIVLVAGNHDFIFDTNPNLVPELECQYLQNSSIVINDMKFYGHPYTSIFYDWAFMLDTKKLEEENNKIPFDTNVLITHGPPLGILDSVNDGKYMRNNLGSHSLRKRVNDLINLNLHVFGHIHSSHGIQMPNKYHINNKGTTFVNASLLDELYDLVYDPIIIEI